jgi:16S rRNA (uracil1498-N3)-methyltransferase
MIFRRLISLNCGGRHEVPRFFVSPEKINDDKLLLEGNDAHHALRVLRLQEGETVVVCDGRANEYVCRVSARLDGKMELCVVSQRKSSSEPSIHAMLFQSLPKGDKLDEIVQKAVELGVSHIVPFISARCIVRIDSEAFEKRKERLCRIALEAAKQSGRGTIPTVGSLMSFSQAVNALAGIERAVLFYEASVSGARLKSVVERGSFSRFGFMIGPEGGFEHEEVLTAQKAGIEVVHLGDRILRVETASGCVLAAVMYATGNL